MKKIFWVFIFVAFGSVSLIFSRFQDTDSYIKTIKKTRKDRNDFMKNSDVSPFIKNHVSYEELSYFPVDKSYKVQAKLYRLTKREKTKIVNSDQSESVYLKFARAKFQLKGKNCSLLILKPLTFGKNYFTAFMDNTSGKTTYEGGRYLDLNIENSDYLELDFNKAYYPYCAYVSDYLCPLPPRENFINVAIEAGEKN